MNANANGNIKQQIEAMYPVTGVQRGMIFHSLLAPGSGVYVLQDSLLLSGRFDRTAFWGAWEEVIRCHPVFRTLFVRLDTEQPVQVVLKDVVLSPVELDWSGLDDAARDAALDQLLRSEQQRGFDFAKAPLMRLQLIRRSADSWYFVWTRHHVLLDGWSGPLVLRDVMHCYDALCNGQKPDLPRARGYQDYVRWLGAQDAGAARDFWTRQLQGFEERTPLPLIGDSGQDAAPRRVEDLQSHAVVAAAELRQGLDTFARSQHVTLNCVFQAAWALLLSRYAGHDAVTFGVTVSGRPHQLPGVESSVGPFINSLPMTIEIDPCQRVGDWLRNLQQFNSDRADFEFVPLVEIQSLAPAAARGALFDSLLVFDNYPIAANPGSATTLSAQPLTSFSYNNYPLTLMVMPGEKLLLQFKYDGARYARAAVEQLLAQLQQLLQKMLEDADAAVGSLCLMSPEAKCGLLAAARGPVVGRVSETVAARFAANAAADPGRLALVFGETMMTAAELDVAANRLAHCLRQSGVAAEARVGLCTQRNSRFVIGLLAILKAGAAYVPIDGDWPESRIEQVLAAAGVDLVVTEQAMLERVAGDGTRGIVSIDRDWDEIVEFPARAPDVEVTPEQLAYVIFTSGSTGVPKGVGVPHAAIVEYVDSVLPRLGLSGVCELASLATAAADLGHTALFGAICGGHALRMLPEALMLDAHALHDELVRRPVDMLKIVPSHLEALLAASATRALLPRQCLVLGGESPSPQLLAQVRSLADCRIINHYGPTETTVGALSCELTAARTIAIGTPMANRSAYLLSGGLQLQPPGAVGELYLGGSGLARGYLGDPRQTAERFVPDPFAEVAGSRMYRTGDRARFTAATEVQYLGRSDQQVKLRGHRIELGEIEGVIRGFPGVSAAAVAVQTGSDGSARLVAYVVGARDIADCAARAAAQLPEAMRPALWQLTSQLPLTANGKLDRRGLPQLAAQVAVTAHVAPASETERRIAEVWADLLKRERVGRDDNFFELGGNSLLIIQAHGRLKKLFEHELSVLDLFKYPTIAKLAEHLRGASSTASALAAVGQRTRQRRPGSARTGEAVDA